MAATNTNPHKIPSYGRPYPCKPIGVAYISPNGLVEWDNGNRKENPKACLKTLTYVAPFSALIGIVALVVGIASWFLPGGNVFLGLFLFVLGIFLTIFFVFLTSILSNWKYNIQKQTAIGKARFKSGEASKLWATVDPVMHLYAKDVYFETPFVRGKALKVLRDGTIEVHGDLSSEEDGIDLGEAADLVECAAEVFEAFDEEEGDD